MSELSIQDISHLSRLARLELTAEEQERFATQLSKVVTYVDQLSSLATEATPEPVGVSGLHNILAADVVRSADDLCAVDSLAIVNGAPAHEGRYFQVRAVMAEEGGAA